MSARLVNVAGYCFAAVMCGVLALLMVRSGQVMSVHSAGSLGLGLVFLVALLVLARGSDRLRGRLCFAVLVFMGLGALSGVTG